MQRAAHNAGYFVLKGPIRFIDVYGIVFIKPLSPLLLDEAELAELEARDTAGGRREREINPFAVASLS
jgi:hypothetical protein